MAVSFDLFGTLVAVERQDDAAAAIAAELARRGVEVPDGWSAAYGEAHADLPPGRERSLVAHVRDALDACGVIAPGPVDDAVRAALFPEPSEITAREGAEAAVAAAAGHGSVGVLSNCSVPGLAGHCLDASGLDPAAFDAVTTSVACGWRKPAPDAFEAVADALGVEPADLVHVGDNPRADGGVTDVGGEFVPVGEIPLTEFPGWLEGEGTQC